MNTTSLINLVEQFIEPNTLDKTTTVAEQKGGLFNDVYKISNHGKSWYIKQYMAQNSSKIFSPPKIAPTIRAKLAFEVQKGCYRLNKDIRTVPDVFLDENTNSLVIEGVLSPKDMVENMYKNTIDLAHISIIAKTIGRLHNQYHNDIKIIKDVIFLNEEFKDFKLQLQYYKIAEEIGGEYKGIIIGLAEKYKKQFITVLHGDLNSRNIIVNTDTNEIGIIDFEQSHIGNPVYDIAYFLCEVYISCLHFKNEKLLKDAIDTFLTAYIAENKKTDMNIYREDLKLHLAVQIIYRFLGLSRNSWTSYIELDSDKQIIINQAKKILLSKKEKYIDSILNQKLMIVT